MDWIPTRLTHAPALLLAAALVACGGNPPPESGVGAPGADATRITAAGDVLTRAQIEAIHAPTMEQLFEGRFTGVMVMPRGTGFTLSIRGGGEPLVMLDGAPTSTSVLSSLHPSDIERIEIVKGPATAIYGRRGTEGVVVVTTRTQ